MSQEDARIIELQLIYSMYPDSLNFFDENLATYLEESADGSEKGGDFVNSIDESAAIEFVFSLPAMLADLYVTLPPGYPEKNEIKAHLRFLDNINYSSSECKNLQVKANTSLREYMVNSPKDMVNVLGLIQWVEDFFGRKEEQKDDVKMNKESNEKEDNKKEEALDANSTLKQDNEEDSSRGGTMTSAYSSQAGKQC